MLPLSLIVSIDLSTVLQYPKTMDGDDLSDDVFIEKQIINRDELRIADGQIPTIPISSGAKVGGGVCKEEGEVRIYAPLDYDEGFITNRHENYFYPENSECGEGWRSYKIEDEEPFGPIGDGPTVGAIRNTKPSQSTYYYQPPAVANSGKHVPRANFDDSVTHKVTGLEIRNKVVINYLQIPVNSITQVIMLGDSGVGKTSFLVHYTTGEFKAGSFSATVGVALTVSVVCDFAEPIGFNRVSKW